MKQITTELLTEFMGEQEGPCVSVYMPTHRSHPENQQDPLVYKNLMKAVEESLHEKYPAVEVAALVEKFSLLEGDKDFWNLRTDGLAVLGSQERFHVFELQRPLPELAIVADSFHLKPLLRIVQSADRYHILYLNRDQVLLYEGNRDSVEQVNLADLPATLTEALGDELTDPRLTAASYGMKGGGDQQMYHGHGGRKEEVTNDTERFFRIVDRAILENYSRPSGLPLMLAGVTEHHADFRAVSHNPNLMDEGLMVDTSAFSMDKLRQLAWEKVEPQYLERLDGLINTYHAAQVDQTGVDPLLQVVQAALDGRIATLLVDADQHIPGRIDAEARDIQRGDLLDPQTDDILDDLAEIVLCNKGEVVVVPAERMPTDSGFAAIYRY